jgi:N-acetylmuramic acid 6-phosphate etherase
MDHLQTEARNPASTRLDELTPLEIVRLMNAEDARVIPAVASQEEAIARAITVIADRLRDGGRLIYVGAGTSGRLGVLDATECPPTFNSPPGQVVGVIAGGPPALTRAVEGAEDHPEYAERDLRDIGLNTKDVLVGIATSGRTPYVLGAAAYARKLGIFTIGIACNADAELNAAVDLPIVPMVGPEVLSGSTRLKAGTATKLVLNILSTGAMVRLGKTYGNLMVDLRATNTKLKARTNRIVRQLTGLSVEDADAMLQRCGGELKTALVAHLARVEPDEARTRLETDGGQVGAALGRAQGQTVPTRPSRDDLFLGIDGGGTHTVALLAARDGSILGRGAAGPSNRQAVGTTKAFASLDEAVAGAFAAAGIARTSVAAACLGLAGGDRADDRNAVQEWARGGNLASRVEVTNDAAILLAAGTPEGWGVALVAGTGSIAYGRAPNGQTARGGGWGYLLGDEGSGYALALAGLQAVARAADGRSEPTRLTERFLARLNLTQPQELIPTIYRGNWDRAALAALAPLVVAAADDDAVSAKIVDAAATELAQTVAVVVNKLGLAETIPLTLTGGVLLASDGYRRRVLNALHELGIRVDLVTLVQEPAEGAVRMAREIPGERNSRTQARPLPVE